MNKTKIEYLTHTWSPIAMRCTPVSEGCKNCWHLALANRLAKNPMIPEDRQKAYAGGEPVLIKNELFAPSRLKKSAIIGVQFMGDLFHEDVKREWIDRIFHVMACASQHTYLLLTKRPERMKNYWMGEIPIRGGAPGYTVKKAGEPHSKVIDHIWLGVTAENQEQADKRIPIFLQIPAMVRFVSNEPMLSKINLRLHDYAESCGSHSIRRYFLRWIICGTESGPRRRPAKIEWIRNLRDQCVSANTSFFLKQMEVNEKVVKMPEIDGRTWDEYPERK